MRSRLKSSVFTAGLAAFFCIQSLAEVYEPVSQAVALFADHRFSEGQTVLLNRLGNPDLPVAEQAAILGTLGDFYCDYVGDYSEAMGFYQRAEELQPDAVPSLKTRMDFIRNAAEQHTEADQIIQEIKGRANWNENTPDTPEKIKTLECHLAASPDYYRSAEARYCIGLYYAAEGKYLNALKQFREAQTIRPALSQSVPVEGRIQAVQSLLNRSLANRISNGLFALLFILSATLFFSAKPWRWLTFKTLGGFALLLMTLSGLFLITGSLLSSRHLHSEAAQTIINAPEKYLFSALVAPGSELWLVLLSYMSAAFLITFVFALGTSVQIRSKPAGALLNGVFGTLIMAATVCLFYMRHCDQKTYGEPPDLSLGSFFGTDNAMPFLTKGIEPCLMTDPDAFPNPGITHSPNGALEKWAAKHCPFTEPPQTEGQ